MQGYINETYSMLLATHANVQDILNSDTQTLEQELKHNLMNMLIKITLALMVTCI